MPFITLAQAAAHLREAEDFPAGQVQPYIAAAEDATAQYLNRTVFATQVELSTAIAALPAALTAARLDYEAAITASALVVNVSDRRDAVAIADAALATARAGFCRTVGGIVINPSIFAAMLLTLGHLYSSREDVVFGATAGELPLGARALLRPYRRVMMP